MTSFYFRRDRDDLTRYGRGRRLPDIGERYHDDRRSRQHSRERYYEEEASDSY